MLDTLLTVVQSAVFWTAVGSVAAVAGAWKLRARQDPTALPSGADIEEFPDAGVFVDAQVAAIDTARTAVVLCLHTTHASDNWKARKINAALRRAHERGLSVRVLTGTGTHQLRGAYELREEGHIPVKHIPELNHSDLRFLKTDEGTVILGVADVPRDSTAYSQSNSWALLTSHGLGDALEREVCRLWYATGAKNLYGICHEHIEPYRASAPASRLAEDLGLPLEFVRRLHSGLTFSARFPGKTIVVHGKAGVGKTTVIRRACREWPGEALDLEPFVLPLVHRLGNERVVGPVIMDIYRALTEAARKNPYDLVETGSEEPAAVLPPIFDAIRAQGRTPVLLHATLPLDDAVERNGRRARPVPLEVMERQAQAESTDRFREVCARHDVSVGTIDMKGAEEKTLAALGSALDQVASG